MGLLGTFLGYNHRFIVCLGPDNQFFVTHRSFFPDFLHPSPNGIVERWEFVVVCAIAAIPLKKPEVHTSVLLDELLPFLTLNQFYTKYVPVYHLEDYHSKPIISIYPTKSSKINKLSSE